MMHQERLAPPRLFSRLFVVLTVCGVALGMVTPVNAEVRHPQQVYTVFVPRPMESTGGERQPGASTHVSLSVTDGTVESALQKIARQTHMGLGYDKTKTPLNQHVTVHVSDVSVTDALAAVTKGTGLVAQIGSDGETILIRRNTASTHAADRLASGIIIGRVTDSATKGGLGGVSVRVAGMKISTVTSDSGNFTLRDIPTGEQVVNVRLFGYKPADRTVTVVDSQRTMMHIMMVPVPTVLSGVVTTASGLQRKVQVGNDITTLNVDSIVQVAPISSVTDLLETRVPGLTVLHSSGVPGDPSRIRIRGAGSITGNSDPIVIVDGIRVYASQSDARNMNLAPSGQPGVSTGTSNGGSGFAAPSPLDQIDPNSITTIEVQKGPSASAMYGSDAANGVIIITTKHGRAGPTQWNLTLGDGVNWMPGNWPVNYYKFGTGLSNDGTGNLFCTWNDLTCHVDSLVPFQALNDPRFTVFTHGTNPTASLSISGGVPLMQYSLTGSAASQLGNVRLPNIEQQRYESYYGPVPKWMVHPDNLQTWGLGGQLTVSPRPNFKVTLSSSLFNSHQQQGALQSAISQVEGEYIEPNLLTSAPLIQNDVQRVTDDQVMSTDVMTVSWQPRPWLPISATAGVNTIQRNDVTYVPYGVNSCSEGGIPAIGITNAFACSQADTTGYYGLGRGLSHDNTFSIATTIPFHRFLQLGLGGDLRSESTADIIASTSQLAPGVTVPTTFPTINNESAFSQTSVGTATYGWFVDPRFAFGTRLFVSPGLRLDGGTASGGHASLVGNPKIDVSYIAVDASRPLGVISSLRPRLAFGYAGTEPGPTEKLRLLGTNTGVASQEVSLDGTTLVPAVFITQLGNSHLHEERERDLEGGFDVGLWHDRFQLQVTQSAKTTVDAIIPIPVAPSIRAVPSNCNGCGIYSEYINVGTIRNTSTELSMTLDVLESRAVSWMVSVNLSNTTNKVLRLNPGQSTINQGASRIEAGYPLWGTWAKPILAFSDANQNGLIDPNEIQYGDSVVFVGQADPKYQMNVNTGVTLLNGRLSVNATFAYQNGLTQFNDGALTSGAYQTLANAPGTSLATQAAMEAAGSCGVLGCPGITNIGLIQTVNTFRFSALSINYNLPTSVSRRFGVPRMSIALQGQNLGLHTNYRGKDPDVNIFATHAGNSGDQTEDAGQIPEPRMWWLKLMLGN